MPIKIKQKLVTNIVTVTAHPHGCLLFFSEKIGKRSRKIFLLASLDEKTSFWKRLILGFAEPIKIDSSNRILIPLSSRQFANIDKKAILIGQGSYFELWDLKSWNQLINKNQKNKWETPDSITGSFFMNELVEHNPVLLKESINLLVNNKDGIYLDGTFGGGGHSKHILKKIDNNGKLIAFDKDYDACMRASLIDDERFNIYHDTYANFENILQLNNVKKINGALLDLGISTFQLNDSKRGISYQLEGKLDMRMDLTKGVALFEWINNANIQDIYSVIKNYGEEPKAKKITNKIKFFRKKKNNHN